MTGKEHSNALERIVENVHAPKTKELLLNIAYYWWNYALVSLFFIFIKWIPEIKSNPFYKDVPILLVGTKADEKNIMKFNKITLQSSGESVIPSFEASFNDSIDSFEGMEMTRSLLESQSEHNSPKISNILDLML